MLLLLLGAAALQLWALRQALTAQASALAQLSAGQGPAAAAALEGLWPSVLGVAVWPAALALAIAGFALRGRRAVRSELRASVQQIQSVLDGRLARIAEPGWPELRPLAAVMNLWLGRQQAVFEASTDQVEALRQQAQVDALTGVSNRRHFLALLEQALGEQSTTPRLGLLLLRVHDLQGLQCRLGHAQGERVLRSVAQVLQTYVQQVRGCRAGRLNAADFCLLLPTGAVALDTAQVLAQALQARLSPIDPGAWVAIGAAELDPPMDLRTAMALTDEALAQAEAERPFSVALAALATHPQPAGEGQWRQWLVDALAQQRIGLHECAVCTPDGRLLHLSCQASVPLHDDGTPATAQRWLALAQRSGLCAQVDEHALDLVLRAIAEDGQARSIRLTTQSLARSDFVAAATRMLEAAPAAALRLSIELPESLAQDRPAQVQEVSRRWRPMGASLILARAGDGLPRIQGLMSLGLDSVRVDARHLQQLSDASSSEARLYLAGLVRLVQAAGLSVLAEGVTSAADLELLWRLGFDAASGPAVQAQAGHRLLA